MPAYPMHRKRDGTYKSYGNCGESEEERRVWPRYGGKQAGQENDNNQKNVEKEASDGPRRVQRHAGSTYWRYVLFGLTAWSLTSLLPALPLHIQTLQIRPNLPRHRGGHKHYQTLGTQRCPLDANPAFLTLLEVSANAILMSLVC
jgi:hypothetical protein